MMDGATRMWSVHPEAAPKQNQQRLVGEVVEIPSIKRKRGRPRKVDKVGHVAEPSVCEEEEEEEETSVVVSTGETSKFSATSMSDEDGDVGCGDSRPRSSSLVDVVQPVKRKRGRPRKIHKSSVEAAEKETRSVLAEAPCVETVEQQPPVKRKRGRPRKLHKESTESPVLHQLEEKMQTRSRRSHHTDEDTCSAVETSETTTTTTPVAKRKRGRPRKVDSARSDACCQSTQVEKDEGRVRSPSLEVVEGRESCGEEFSRRHLRRRSIFSDSKDDDEAASVAPAPVVEVDVAEECQRSMLKPPYDVFTIPRPPMDEVEFEAACELTEVNGRSEWIALLPEMMSICNEASRRSTLAKDSKARFFDKPLAADYMYDRVALASEEPRGFVCRERFGERGMQGFIMVGTFASWDSTLRFSSVDPRAWGVVDYDPHRTARSGTSWGRRRRSSADSSGGASSAYPRKNPTSTKIDALDRKIVAYMEAADAAFQVANRLAAEERRDADGAVSDELESTLRRVSASDDRFTEWPDLLEISLLGALGCGRRLVERVVAAEASDYRFVILQATEAAVHFYEKRGFVRVGALAKYRDRKDMPELAYRHWNDRITVGSQAHGASHMMAMKLKESDDRDVFSPPPRKKRRTTAREDVEAVARAALLTNTNVIGGSGVFRELVVIAQGLAGKFGANDLELSRALAEALVVFKSNSCGTSKLILKRDVLGLSEDEITPMLKRGPNPSSGAKRATRGIRLRFDDDDEDDDEEEDDIGPPPIYVKLSVVVDELPARPPALRAVARLDGFRRPKKIAVKLFGPSTSLFAALSPDSIVLREKNRERCEEEIKRGSAESGRETGDEQKEVLLLSVGDAVMFRFDPPVLWSKLELIRRPRNNEFLLDDRYDDGRHVLRENLWVCRCEDDTDLLVTLNPEERGTDVERDRWYPLLPPLPDPKEGEDSAAAA